MPRHEERADIRLTRGAVQRGFAGRADRRPNDHGAFGGDGAHLCLGASLVRRELRVMFEELLRVLPDAELASDASLPLRPSNFIVGIEHMPIAFTPREL